MQNTFLARSTECSPATKTQMIAMCNTGLQVQPPCITDLPKFTQEQSRSQGSVKVGTGFSFNVNAADGEINGDRTPVNALCVAQTSGDSPRVCDSSLRVKAYRSCLSGFRNLLDVTLTDFLSSLLASVQPTLATASVLGPGPLAGAC